MEGPVMPLAVAEEVQSDRTGVLMDPQTVVEYLIALLKVTLGASDGDLELPGSLLSKSNRLDTLNRCTRFASENQVVLYIHKESWINEASNGVNGDHGNAH